MFGGTWERLKPRDPVFWFPPMLLMFWLVVLLSPTEPI